MAARWAFFALYLAPTATAEYKQPQLPVAGIRKSSKEWAGRPFVDGSKTLIGGVVRAFEGPSATVFSPVFDVETGERIAIGTQAQMAEDQALEALAAAEKAWDGGQGPWPQMSLGERIAAVERVVAELKESREEIVNTLMWEIAKNSKDAAAEFDRTMEFVARTIETLREMDGASASWRLVSGVLAWVRRAAIGIMLALGPYNYPFNETYATIIPALLMGNVVVMKLPAVGGLAHVLTMGAYAKHLPPGVVNFVSGGGRATMPPIMRRGTVDVLAFIGGERAADALVKEHPHPHRLHVFMNLAAKNLGIVTAGAPLDVAVAQAVLGSTSYNGQRCTALKLLLVHASVADAFVPAFVRAVASLRAGLPWEDGVALTPLPQPDKPAYLAGLVADALANGASVVNAQHGGGALAGALMTPAVVYPVTPAMRLWHEEQFGPVIPIGVYSDDAELLAYARATPFGQQASIFASSSSAAAPLVDALSTVVGRININTQCGRSPDELPFSGRRSSALGTMSISDALKVFSVETLVATKAGASAGLNERVAEGLPAASVFMRALDADREKAEL